MKSHKTDDVYGISRDLPLNYVARNQVDGRFVDDLTRGKHVVIFGSSKQGKTCLRKSWLTPQEHILIQCSNKWNLDDLHASILKQSGFQITQSTKKTVSGRQKIFASIKAAIFGSEAGGGAEAERSHATETSTTDLELDPTDVNDVIKAFKAISFMKHIVLEDFHYLPSETQNDFAVALKAFHEASELCFVIVGVWLEENRLITLNGDLSGRVIAVNADKWTRDELEQVIDDGAKLLNIKFDSRFKAELLNHCRESVYIVQEVCHQACKNAGISATLNEPRYIGTNANVGQMVKEVIDQQSARYETFITQFADGFQDTELHMYQWLLYPILTATPRDLENGLPYANIRKTIQAKHPLKTGLNIGNLTQALRSAASLQVRKGIKPIVLDYDQNYKRLNVVDKGFLIWLANQNKADLLETAGFEESMVSEFRLLATPTQAS